MCIRDRAANNFAAEIVKLNGVEEVTLRYEDGVAYLKVDNQQLDKNQLQSLISEHVNS